MLTFDYTIHGEKMTLEEIISNHELLEIGRKAIEAILIDRRNSRIFILRNNGLVCKERNGDPSNIIRMGPEEAIIIGLEAISNHLKTIKHE